jgi:hypothetical protein
VVDGRRCRWLHAKRAKTKQQCSNVPWVRERESALGAIVREGEAQELGSNGMRLDVIETRKTRDKKIEVVAILVFDTKIVDD